MTKHYDLVGSVYDKYAKGNKYKEEEIIKIPGVALKSLEDIDKFTAGLIGPEELKSKIDKKYQNKSTFAIRVTTDNEKFYYKSIIYNNPNLVKIASSLKQNTVYRASGPRTIKMYLGTDDLFMDAWGEVLNKIINSKVNDEDREWLYSVFGEKSRYTTSINRYIKGDPYDSETDKTLLDLEQDFREYEVFRKYLTNKDKAKNKTTISNVKVTSSNIPLKTSLDVIEEKLGSDISYVSLDDEDDDYEPDDFAFLSPEEREKAYGEGNEDIEEHRRRR